MTPTLHATGSNWAVATPHSLATDAAVVAYEQGGTAVDAALAAAVTLAVVYPHMCGVGGDLFALIRHPDGAVVALNASGRAPMGTDPDGLRATHGLTVPMYGPASVTVPGAVSGWRMLHDQGARLPWVDAFVAAIAYAHGGVSVSKSLDETLTFDPDRLRQDPGLAETFFRDGAPLGRGEQVRQPALGATLQALASFGPEALYGGEVGVRYVAGLREQGVPITVEDLQTHTADLGAPLNGRYREVDVQVCPPNSQGFVLLEMLSLIERMGLDPDPVGPDAGLIALVLGAAARDRDLHLADARAMRIHATALLDDGHLSSVVDEVRGLDTGAHRGRSPVTGDTIALVAADASGMAVSLIQSLYNGFGSGILEPSTGVVAQDRGACFTLDPAHANVLAPGKRPAHTLMPVMVQRGGELDIVAGTMGGSAQPQINAINLLRCLDLGMTPADAIAAPRWLIGGKDPETGDPFMEVETSVATRAVDAFRNDGFEIRERPDTSGDLGHSHIIRATPEGFVVGSDPRADGSGAAG
ncbi:MAG: gamma-glutamyltransferase [Actinomycetota bacterium]